jgi:energy-coupling factor transporter ATP-binding protein EcfA2
MAIIAPLAFLAGVLLLRRARWAISWQSRCSSFRRYSLLEQVGMAENAHKLPSAVSGGQQRVAIARALANDPPILIADEPTGNLDSKTAESVFHMFEQLVDQGKTILMVTHDQDLAKRVTRTVIIADGEVIDEYLAKALPMLSEDQQIWATHNIETLSYQPGAAIIREGTPPDNFYIITKGRVDIVLQQSSGSEIVVATMGVGQYFGEIALLRGGTHNATVRAGYDTGVEVVALDRDDRAERLRAMGFGDRRRGLAPRRCGRRGTVTGGRAARRTIRLCPCH